MFTRTQNRLTSKNYNILKICCNKILKVNKKRIKRWRLLSFLKPFLRKFPFFVMQLIISSHKARLLDLKCRTKYFMAKTKDQMISYQFSVSLTCVAVLKCCVKKSQVRSNQWNYWHHWDLQRQTSDQVINKPDVYRCSYQKINSD